MTETPRFDELASVSTGYAVKVVLMTAGLLVLGFWLPLLLIGFLAGIGEN